MLKFFLSGLNAMLSITCDTKLKQKLMVEIIKKLKPYLTERETRFFVLAARSAIFRVKMNSESSFELFMDFLNTLKVDIPDGADLIDFIGELAAQHRVVELIKQLPALDQVINWIKDECVCDYTFALAVKNGAFHLRLQTEGIKELYEKVLEGFK